MKCTNCGNRVPDTAKVCGNCGHRLKSGAARQAEVSQEQVQISPAAVRSVVPGWAWGLIGLLFGIIATGVLALGGVIPFSLPVLDQIEPTIANTPSEFTPVTNYEGYCPESGGVILFWNSDENCWNSTGDPGYRQRIGDGAQDVNTGQFDNQATSIKIPKGWSVRLWENPGLTGGNICFILSVRDFTPKGAFPGSTTAINDNVSSMEVFRDSSCGEDLAAGALPAPWPEDARGPEGPNAQEPVNDENAVCDDLTPCACLPGELEESIIANEFREGYIENMRVIDGKVEIVFKNFDSIFDEVAATPLKIKVRVDIKGEDASRYVEPECKPNGGVPSLVTCSGSLGEPMPEHGSENYLKIYFEYESEIVFDSCSTVDFNLPGSYLLSSDQQCVSPNGVVCGSFCCGDQEACVVKRNKLVCESAREADAEPSEPKSECQSPPASFCPP